MSTEIQRLEDFKSRLEQIRLLFPSLARVSEQELIKALAVSKHLGLDPIKKEVHFVPYGNTVQLVVSYTEYIKRAERSGRLNGWNVVYGNDKDLGTYAEIVIHRKDWEHPFVWRVYLNEVKQESPLWKKSPSFMLRKTAIAQGFRLAFPEEVAELPYEEAELPPNNYHPSVNPITGEVIEISTESSALEDVEMATERQIKAIHVIAAKKGINHKNLIKEKFGVESSKELTKEQASQLIAELQKEDTEEEVPF
jgi:phage recombination protein Bet